MVVVQDEEKCAKWKYLYDKSVVLDEAGKRNIPQWRETSKCLMVAAQDEE